MLTTDINRLKTRQMLDQILSQKQMKRKTKSPAHVLNQAIKLKSFIRIRKPGEEDTESSASLEAADIDQLRKSTIKEEEATIISENGDKSESEAEQIQVLEQEMLKSEDQQKQIENQLEDGPELSPQDLLLTGEQVSDVAHLGPGCIFGE